MRVVDHVFSDREFAVEGITRVRRSAKAVSILSQLGNKLFSHKTPWTTEKKMRSIIPAILVLTLVTGCTGNNEKTKVEFVSAKLARFKNPEGTVFQEVIATWKNVGDSPVRLVDATMTPRDAKGNLMNSFTPTGSHNYTIYAEFDHNPGVLPGETYTTKNGNGFKLPGFEGMGGYMPAVSVDVEITKSAKTSGL